MDFPEAETATLDPDGRGWVYKDLESIIHKPPDSCQVVLIKNVKYNQQVFNNYGSLNNVELLSKYGFIDPECQIDTVCLRQEIFLKQTEYYTPDPERMKFWFEQGFKFLRTLAEHEKRPFAREWDLMKEHEIIPEEGREWVMWSLTVSKGGYTRCGLKVWLLLVDFLPGVWNEFMSLSMDKKVDLMLQYLSVFTHERDLMQFEERVFSGWLNLLRHAVLERYSRYSLQDNNDYDWRRNRFIGSFHAGKVDVLPLSEVELTCSLARERKSQGLSKRMRFRF